ncbi:hornerin-like [Hylaeus volcanicus]|uniref:hornerin-like n=1 Tax=Hylaeus volcanicus TaxID=313075 RepID=UPI0023B7EC31|nr:hornerin-like [Hylaeus volcanicus]XP_053972773.1 hornerin-like [Hylaeus volcanicus]
MIDRIIVAVLLGLLGLSYGLQCPKQKTSPGREVVCYTSVSDVEQLTNTICRCTTLVHQGYDVRNLSTSGFESFQKSLKGINPPLQFVISVDDSGNTLRTSGTVRQEIIARLMGILKEVDGVELNMTAGSKERLVHFVKGLRDEFVRKSYDKRIFLVLPTKPEDLAKQFDLKELSKYVDLFTVPTHYLVEDDEDYHTFHPSRLMGLFDMFNTDSLIDLISGLGAPKRKILVSVPASAYKFSLKDEDDNTPRSSTVERQPVIIDQKQLCDSMSKGEWTIERDEDLTAPYAFKNKTWIAFEDKISIAIKGKYALLRNLPGLAIRDVQNDFETKCGKPLTHEIHHSFTDFKRKSRAAVLNALEDDLHQTQLTYPTKVKSSEFRVVRVVDTEGHIRVARENTQTEFTCSRQGYFVHPKSCNRFYRCVKFNQEVEDYSVFEFDCPAGLSFDESTEVCVWPGSLPQGSPCPGSSEIAPVARVRFECPSKPGYYADPQNPRWFFACIDLGGPQMMAYEFRCPFGLIFDEEKFVCEWPWLVRGYSDSGYTRPEYDYSGGQSSVGTGGYFTGALPQGHGGTTGFQNGVYTGTTVGVGYSNTGATGVYSGHSGFSGAAGVGYDGSNVGGHGSFDQGSTGYSGTGGGGYSGSTAGSHTGTGGQHGTGLGGYSGSGSGSTGYSGSSGNGYSGTTTGGHVSTGGQHGVGLGGYSGSGSTSGSNIGTGGQHGSVPGGYSGSGSTGYSGSTGSGYSGTTKGGHVSTGGQHGVGLGGYSGSGSTGYSGSTGSGYSGTIGIGGQHGTVSGGYSGSGSTGYSGSTGSGYSGTTTGGHIGTGGQHGIVSGGYSGSGSTGYSGSTGSGYSGTTTGGHIGTGGQHGTVSGGYSGSGSIAGSHGGSTGSGYTGSANTGYFGSTNEIYTGSGHAGSAGTEYSGVTGTGQVSTGSGYAGTGGTVHAGSNGIYSGGAGTGSHFPGQETESGYSGSTIGIHGGSTGGGYSGSTGGGYSGSTGISYTGSGTKGQGGSSGGGYAGSTGDVHRSFSGSDYTGGYAGSSSGAYAGSTGGGYSGSSTGVHPGSAGTSYTGSGTKDYGGSTGGGYSGSSAGVHPGSAGTSYTGSGTKDYGGSTGGGYSGSSAGVHPGSAGTGYTGSTPGVYTGSGNVHPSSPGSGYTGGYAGSTSGGHAESTGTSYVETSTGGYSESTGPGYSTGGHGDSGVKGGGGQRPGPIYVPKPDGPVVDCGRSFDCQGSSQQSGGQSYNTNGYSTTHGVSTGSVFPGQSVSTTYFGNSGTKGYGGTSSGTTIYHGANGYPGGYKGPPGPGDLNTTLVGGHTLTIGGITYHGFGTPSVTYGTAGTPGAGAVITGNSVQGTILTGDSSPGSVITYGDTQGTVISGSSDQGTIVTGSSHPGYVTSVTGTPGYVVSGGVKTVYTGSSSHGTSVYGTPAPGILLTGPPDAGTVLHGASTPGIVLTGQTAPGVTLGGSVQPGTIIGSTGHGISTGFSHQGGFSTGSTYGTGIGSVPVTHDTGYKTNEYHDNGGRGTIRFNNGDVTTKYTENDIPDYRPGGGFPPDSIIPPGHSTGIPGTQVPTGFTKTGSTKTGITTASLGGHGSYVISTGKPRPATNADHIGAKAFEGNVAGYTKTSTESNIQVYSGQTSTQSQDVNHIDTSKITFGPSKSGYSYPTPSIPFQTGVTSSAGIPIAPTQGSVPTVTTPTPFLSVEMYKSPKFGGFTGSSDVVSTFNGPTGGDYQGKVPSGFTRESISTVTPAGYTTGSLDSYKATSFESSKIPIIISTVQTAVDTGYKTLVSSTPGPATVNHDKFRGNIQDGNTFSQSQFDFGTRTSQRGGQNGYVSSTTPSSVFGGSSTYSIKPRPFGTSTSSPFVTEQPQTNYISSTFGSEYVESTSRTSFDQVTPASISDSLKPQTQYLPTDYNSPGVGVTYRKPFTTPDITYQQSTPLTPVTQSGGSPSGVDISRDEVGKLVTNYRGSTKYVPSQYDVYTPIQSTSNARGDFSKSQTSSLSTFGQSYGSSTSAPFGKSQSSLSRGYSTPSTIVSYQTTAKSTAVGKSKVIVKWSDLHPLLLGKLGAECTCKGDPFANLRGPGSKLINSSRGKVDLSNYDDSEIYVDLEKDVSYEDDDYVTNYESSSKGPLKIWTEETPAPGFQYSTVSQIREKPSTAYLPSVTPDSGFRVNVPLSPQNLIGGTSSRGLASNFRSGKSLNNNGATTNSVSTGGASFDRYGPGGLRDSEEVLEGATNCARPGLFRHPNFCNKFYACHWDEWKKKFTLHVFNCPVHLTFDNGAGACNWPSMGPACQDDNLLV